MIRKATAKDIPHLFSLLKELYPDYAYDEAAYKKVFTTQKEEGNVHLVLEKEGIVGFASISFRINTQVCGKTAELEELIVTKKERGKGVGTALLAAAEEEAKKKGAKELGFTSTFKRKKAHEFYKKKGYKTTAYFFWKEL